MNIVKDWLLEIRKRVCITSGYVTRESLSEFGRVCFYQGVQYLYKWRNFLIEQPKDFDIIVIEGGKDLPHAKYRVGIYYESIKKVIEVSTQQEIRVDSTTRWKLVQTSEKNGKFNRISYKEPNYCDPCKDNSPMVQHSVDCFTEE